MALHPEYVLTHTLTILYIILYRARAARRLTPCNNNDNNYKESSCTCMSAGVQVRERLSCMCSRSIMLAMMGVN